MPDPNTAFTAAALSLAAALAGCLPSEDSCTDLECSGNARLLLRYSPPAPESLVGGHLRICRNDRCNEETIAANGELYALGFVLPLGTELEIQTYVFTASGLDLSLGVANADVRDGDTYSAELRDSSGAIVASKTWQATYEERRPFGPECGSVVCQSVSLD